MAGSYVEVFVESDEATLGDNAIQRLRDQWDGWTPDEGDLEVIQIEALAPMAQNAAETAARVPPAVFTTIGEDLYGVPHSLGRPATTTVTFTMLDAAGYKIKAGDEVDIDGFAFVLDADAVVPPGETTVSGVPVTAAELGTQANDLTGSAVTMITAVKGSPTVTLDAPTSNGLDEETESDYRNKVARELRLQAKTLVTPRDFELWALNKQGVDRAYAENLGARQVRVTVATSDGSVVSPGVKAELVADYETFRLANTTFTIADPTRAVIDVDYAVVAYPGFDAADLKTRIDAALTEFLNPATWGRPTYFGETSEGVDEWLNEPVVRALKLVDVIASVQGVNYVDALSLNSDTPGAVLHGYGLEMPGPVPLPQVGTLTGTIL